MCSLIVLTPNRFQAIALFNANQHEDAMERIHELATACHSADTLACRMVEVNIDSIKLGCTSSILIILTFAC